MPTDRRGARAAANGASWPSLAHGAREWTAAQQRAAAWLGPHSGSCPGWAAEFSAPPPPPRKAPSVPPGNRAADGHAADRIMARPHGARWSETAGAATVWATAARRWPGPRLVDA